MSTPRSFESFCAGKSDDKKKEFEEILFSASLRTMSQGGRDFVQSCKNFFKKNGMLTAKQITALNDMGRRDWDSGSYDYFNEELDRDGGGDAWMEYYASPDEFCGDR